MRTFRHIAPLFLAVPLALATEPAQAQRTQDSSAVPAAAPPWRGSVRYGGGPSVGAPPSDYNGEKPPAMWCLQATGRAAGDLGRSGDTWARISRSWLRQVLSDTTDFGDGWRKVLGGAPRLAPGDSIVQVVDEDECRTIAQLINHDLLGWEVGPPPVVIFRVRDYIVAYPSNAWRGEFGYAVGMNLRHEIRGVATW
jgi:hypothetical protein